MISERLNSLFSAYAKSERPREKIVLLREIIAVMKAAYPQHREKLETLEGRVSTIARFANWDAYTSYAAVGRWEVLDDGEYFAFNELLAELDDILSTLVYLVEKEKATWKSRLRRGPI